MQFYTSLIPVVVVTHVVTHFPYLLQSVHKQHFQMLWSGTFPENSQNYCWKKSKTSFCSDFWGFLTLIESWNSIVAIKQFFTLIWSLDTTRSRYKQFGKTKYSYDHTADQHISQPYLCYKPCKWQEFVLNLSNHCITMRNIFKMKTLS